MKKHASAPTDTPQKTYSRKRRRGEGSLEKHNGIYRGVYQYTDDVTGAKQRLTHSFGTASRSEAERELKKWVKQFQGECNLERLETLQRHIEGERATLARQEESKPAMLIADAWNAYLESKERPDTGEATLRQYGFQFSRFRKWVEATHPTATELRHIDKELAGEFLACLGSKDKQGGVKLSGGNALNGVLHGVGNGTYNKYITLFTLVWKTLTEQARLTCNPWEGFKKKLNKQHSRRELTREEIARVLQVLEQGDRDLYLLFVVGIYTGLRLEDCVKLHWSAIDLERGLINTIPIKTAKTNRGVIIPIHAHLRRLLEERQERNGLVFPVFASVYDRRNQTLVKWIQNAFIKAGIETCTEVEGNFQKATDVGFHSLRHTFASVCAANHVPLAIVQAIVGHSNPSMTLHYMHASELALRNAVDSIPSFDLESKATGLLEGGSETATETRSATWERFVETARELTEEETERAIRYLTALQGKRTATEA